MVTRASDVFVGRARELEELERALDAVRGGSGATVLIAGDAGIGKSRLASELALRARDAEFEVLVGQAIELVGAELPYQLFVDALRPLGRAGSRPASQLQVFEDTLALLEERAAAAPLLLVLEDVHWADVSTLDLVAFLAHNLVPHRVLLAATCRADEPSSAERMQRVTAAVRRSPSSAVLELGPLERDELTTLIEARAGSSLSAAAATAIVRRSEGNPFFAEELLTVATKDDSPLPLGLRGVLLQRIARLSKSAQHVVRVAAAAGREAGYPLLRAAADLPESDLREALRQAVEHGVLVAVPETSSYRFRHALLAEAVYATILPGEREALHARLADELTRQGGVPAGELAPHWAAAGRTREALAASLDAAREAEAVFGLAEALAHLERALGLWDTVPDARELAGLDLVELCTRTAEVASLVADAGRAVELGRRAVEAVGENDPHRAALLHVRLGEYLEQTGSEEACLAAVERAVELASAGSPSPERAWALASLAGVLCVTGRHAESWSIGEQALALAREIDAPEAEIRALTVRGTNLAYLGRADEGIAALHQALQLADEFDDDLGLDRAWTHLTDVLTMLGRLRESARLGWEGLEVMHRRGIDNPLLTANQIETLAAIGDWDEADRLSAASLRRITSSFPYWLLTIRAGVEIGRGEFEAARAHLEAATATLREDRVLGLYDTHLADLALWERRWADAEAAVREGLAHSRQRAVTHVRVQLCAEGLRAYAELAAVARARRNPDDAGAWAARADDLVGIARDAAAEASAITPNADGWLALAEAEHARAHALTDPDPWSSAAVTWTRLERPPLAAYCRFRQAEALVTAGASRIEAAGPLRDAHAVATRIGAGPLLREVELLAQRARIDLAPEDVSAEERGPLEDTLGLTPREAQVLRLVARGYTNREIAAALVISEKTAGVHVSHILRKLDAPNRREAAAIAHRLAGDTDDA